MFGGRARPIGMALALRSLTLVNVHVLQRHHVIAPKRVTCMNR